MSSDAPRATLAILNYNGRELLDVVVPSVLALRGVDQARVVVIDDGSSDDSCRHIRERWPEVEVVEIGHNVGVAAALNRAVSESDTELVALLNNDIELDPDWLVQLTAALDAHPRAGSACGKLLRFHDRSTIDAAGDLMLWSGAVVNRGHGMPDRGQYDSPQAVFASCAGAALYRRSAFEEVGPFDESFFAYLEDIDWGIRAQLVGLTAWYEPRAVGYHMGGATTSRRKGYFGRLQRRNTLLMIAKDFPAEGLLRHGWKIALNQLLWLAASARDGMLGEQLRAWGEAILGLPGALRSRRRIQRGRRVSPGELEATIDASLPWAMSGAERLLFEVAPLQASRRAAARL